MKKNLDYLLDNILKGVKYAFEKFFPIVISIVIALFLGLSIFQTLFS